MEKFSELQENASIGERRISLYSNRFFKSKFLLFRLKSSAKNYEDYSKESCMKIETFYFYTVALYDVGVKTINKFNPIPYSTLKNSYFVVYRRGLGNI